MSSRLSSSLLVVATMAVWGPMAARGEDRPPGDRSTPQPSSPTCAVADDPEYAYTSGKPVQVGGGSMYGPVRQRRYLDALRGPEGQPIRYKRTGSLLGPDRETVLDGYVVTYDGLEKPLNLFLDSYHFNDAKPPRGLVCGQSPELALPPADPITAMPELMALAIEQGAQRDFEPIPLDAERPARGVAYDHFRLVARAARAAVEGRRLDPQSPPRDLARPRTVVLVRPLTCDGSAVSPTDVTIVTPQGEALRRDQTDGQKETLATLLPGVDVPALHVAAVYGLDWPRPGLTVKVTYREPACPGDLAEVLLPVRFTPPKLVESPSATLPAGVAAPAERVTLQVLIDHEGAIRRPIAIGGPKELTAAAIAALATWRAEPARVNGAPVVVPIVVQVSFTPAAPD